MASGGWTPLVITSSSSREMIMQSSTYFRKDFCDLPWDSQDIPIYIII